MSELLSAKEFLAKLRQGRVADISESTFSEWVKQGAIPYHTKPGKKRRFFKYDEAKAAVIGIAGGRHLSPSETHLADMTDEEREEYAKRLGEEGEALDKLKQKAKAAVVDDLSIDIVGASLNEVRIFKELYLGKMAQLEYRKKSGELLEASEVSRDIYEAGTIIKTTLLSIPSRLAPRIVEMDDPREIEAYLTEEFTRALEALSKMMAPGEHEQE